MLCYMWVIVITGEEGIALSHEAGAIRVWANVTRKVSLRLALQSTRCTRRRVWKSNFVKESTCA